MNRSEQKNFEAIKNSNLAGCFVTADGQALRPDSIFFIKGSNEWSNDYQSMLGTDGLPDGTPARYKMNLRERLALGDDGSVVSLRGNALKLDEPVLLQSYDNGEGYNYLNGKRLARLLYSTWNGQIPAGLEVDHLNRNRADDRLSNLRLTTHSGNLKNRKTRGRNSWSAADRVLLIPEKSGDPVLVHPTKAYGIVRDCNTWKLIHGYRKTANGWHAILNPKKSDVTGHFRAYPDLNRAGLLDKCLALVS